MAHNETLAGRVREELEARRGIVEKRMFGGVAFLLHGNMSVGVHKDDLIVRLAHEAAEKALAEPGARPFDITGKPMKGWLLVGPAGTTSAKSLRSWISRSLAFSATLPPK